MVSFAWARAAVLLLSSAASAASGAGCKVDRTGIFPNGQVPVRLARGPDRSPSADFALFEAPLAVNTDGAPTSYHPDDFLGVRLAINRIDNGILIGRVDHAKLTVAQKRQVFDQWRSSQAWAVPEGYSIVWKNVIAADEQGHPCIFRQGENAGYFGSLTKLENGLSPAEAGECSARDQLDLRVIPATVIRGGTVNPLAAFGAGVGDLVLAINPTTRAVVPAIVGDSGDANRIGEGSVALNMRLLGRPDQPRTYPEAKRLDTGTASMIIATMPGTRAYKRERPYSATNIAARVDAWATEQYGSRDAMEAAVLACADGL